jgi:hypothetical protein
MKSLNLATNPTTPTEHAQAIGFNISNHVIKNGIITFASYPDVIGMQAPCPT